MSFPPVVLPVNLGGTNGFRVDGARALDNSGASVDGAGDFNGDGLDDLIIGAPVSYPRDRVDPGAAYVVFGREGAGFDPALDLGTLKAADGVRLVGKPGDFTGSSVSGLGDVNGDSVDDVLIGGRTRHVVFGQVGGGLGASLDLKSLSPEQGFRLAGPVSNSVSGAGDVNGDGIDDFLVGVSFFYPGGIRRAGAAYVVFGRDGGGFPATLDLTTLDGTDGFRLDGAAVSEYVGDSVAAAGDVNGDGLGDLVVGATGVDTPGGRAAGAAYVVFGREGGFPAALDIGSLDGADGFRLDGATYNDRAGWDVSAAGDVNGDGIDDVIVAALLAFEPSGRPPRGASYVVFGRADGRFEPSLDLGALDGTDGFRIDGAGRAVAGAGDVNGDGLADILLGDGGLFGDGSGYLVFGRKEGFAAAIDVRDLGGTVGSRLEGVGGSVLAAAGDVNGDGFADLLLGDGYADPDGRTTAGSTYVVFGGPTPTTLTANPDRATPDGPRPAFVDATVNDIDPGGAIVGTPRLAAAPTHGVALVTEDGDFLYVPDFAFAGLDRFTYRIRDDDGNAARGEVTAVVAGRRAVKGTAGDDALEGNGRANDILLGLGGDDVVHGRTSDLNFGSLTIGDTLVGNGGDDRLVGGDADDVLRGGSGRDELRGGYGGDLFVLEAGGGRDVIREDFTYYGGDAVAIADPALLLADGRLDGSRVAAVDAGSALLLRADLDGDGAFEAVLARVAGGAGLGLDDVLLNAIG